jgi:hypothetical protein
MQARSDCFPKQLGIPQINHRNSKQEFQSRNKRLTPASGCWDVHKNSKKSRNSMWINHSMKFQELGGISINQEFAWKVVTIA